MKTTEIHNVKWLNFSDFWLKLSCFSSSFYKSHILKFSTFGLCSEGSAVPQEISAVREGVEMFRENQQMKGVDKGDMLGWGTSVQRDEDNERPYNKAGS